MTLECANHRGDIVAVVDRDPAKIGTCWGELVVRDVADLEQIAQAEGVEIAILVTPADPAQQLVDRLVAAGVTAVNANYRLMEMGNRTYDYGTKATHIIDWSGAETITGQGEGRFVTERAPHPKSEGHKFN